MLKPVVFVACLIGTLAVSTPVRSAEAPAWQFIDNKDGTVTHVRTGLIWMRCTLGQTWNQATQRCENEAIEYTWSTAVKLRASFAGQSDWRLPDIQELQSIIERDNTEPAIDSRVFPNTPLTWFWSSSPYVGNAGLAWAVNFGPGDVGYSDTDPDRSGSVRLVRGQSGVGVGQSSHFNVPADSVVTDRITGLMWARCSLGQFWQDDTCQGEAQRYTLNEALLQRSTLAGYSDWRLPTASELATLIDYSRESPAANDDLFAAIPSDRFWSSSPYIGENQDGWVVNFNNGGVYGSPANYTVAVRLVRGGLCQTGKVCKYPKPAAFRIMNDQHGLKPGAVITSKPVTVKGLKSRTIKEGTPIHLSGGQYSINGGTYTERPGVVKNGDKVRVRVVAGASDSSTRVTLTIGGVSDRFTVNTLDMTPEAFNFPVLTRQERGQTITTEPFVVQGLEVPVPVSVTGGQYAVNGNDYTTEPGEVKNGDKIQIQVVTAKKFEAATTLTLQVGAGVSTFTATTRSPDLTPDPYPLDGVQDAAINEWVFSDPFIVSGLEIPATITVQGGQYSINGGEYTNRPGKVRNGDAVGVRVMTPNQYTTPTFTATSAATLRIGDTEEIFTVTVQPVQPPDAVPNIFRFEDQKAVNPNRVFSSNPVVIKGINVGTPVSITGGYYSINDGPFSDTVGIIKNGDTVTVRLISASQPNTAVTATLTVGGVSDDFTVTTAQ